MKRRYLAALCAASLGGLMGAVGAAPQATAGCARADVWMTRAGTTSTTYVTPWSPGSCVVPTPFNEASTIDVGDKEGWIPPPLPNGAGARITVVVP